MNILVQSDISIKPRSDKVRLAANTVRSVVTESSFFNWKWVVLDLVVLAVWIVK